MNQRKAQFATALLALPLVFLAQCTSGDDSDDEPNNEPGYVPDPPVVECTTVDQCPLPASTCANSLNLAFYTNARCESGHCAWDQKSMGCQGSCSNGACFSSITSTAAGGPPFDPCAGAPANTPGCVGGAGGSGDDEGDGGPCDREDDGGPGQCVFLP